MGKSQREIAKERMGALSARIASLKRDAEAFEASFDSGGGDFYDSEYLHGIYDELEPLYAQRFEIAAYLESIGEASDA